MALDAFILHTQATCCAYSLQFIIVLSLSDMGEEPVPTLLDS